MRKVGILAAASMLLLSALFLYTQIQGGNHLLEHPPDGEWIRFGEAFSPMARPSGVVTTIFDYCFMVDKIPATADFRFTIRGSADLQVNQQVVKQIGPNGGPRIRETVSDIAENLRVGPNRILVVVRNQDGHPVMSAASKALVIATGRGWRASQDGVTWLPAVAIDRIIPPQVTRDFEKSARNIYPLAGILMLIVFSLAALWARGAGYYRVPQQRIGAFFTPQRIRWLLIVLWGVLLINNIGKIPLLVGMDTEHHYAYIDYLIHNKALPYASDGVQMFQPPLFYLIAALLKVIFLQFLGETTANIMIRLIPLLCGLGMIEICYRSLKLVFPDHSNLQKLGLIFSSLMPMNLYMSQVVGNEPLAALFTGLTIYFTLRMSLSNLERKGGDYVCLGLVFGLGLLTKPTPLLLLPVLGVVGLYHCWCDQDDLGGRMRLFVLRTTICGGTVLVVCGWYYVRNYFELGRFFVGGWDPAGFNQWWQDPSYRTIHQLTTFGQAWLNPVYASMYGFWDALYATMWTDGNISGITNYFERPPWNYTAMFLCGMLSIFPTIAGLNGIVLSLIGNTGGIQLRSLIPAGSIFLYLAAMLGLFLALPVYSTVKATYTLGLLPCYALSIASGFKPFIPHPYAGAVVSGLTIIWAFSAYAGFFVL